MFLNNWIQNYVVPNDDAGFALKAQKAAEGSAGRRGGDSGQARGYRAVAFLRPHFQLDELTISMRLVADLPATGEIKVERDRKVKEERITWHLILT